MSKPTQIQLAAALALPFLFIPVKRAAIPGERLQVAGTFSVKYVKQEALPAGDVQGHVLILTESRGTNRSTGKDAYMNGAEVVTREIGELNQGTGPDNGYLVFSQGGEETYSRWGGRVTTVVAADGKPSTTFEGTWTKLGGTGRYEESTGFGTYTGRMLSSTEYVVDWQGEIVLQGRTASK